MHAEDLKGATKGVQGIGLQQVFHCYVHIISREQQGGLCSARGCFEVSPTREHGQSEKAVKVQCVQEIKQKPLLGLCWGEMTRYADSAPTGRWRASSPFPAPGPHSVLTRLSMSNTQYPFSSIYGTYATFSRL